MIIYSYRKEPYTHTTIVTVLVYDDSGKKE